MYTGAMVCLAIFVLGALLSLVQLWFMPLSAEVFTKVMITLGVLLVVALVVTLVRREYLAEKKMKDQGYID